MGAFTELSLFTGAGGGLLATQHLLGWKTVCYVERERYCIDVLKARISDGFIDDAPIWDDVRTFDGRPWRGLVDCITAGFPCQPFSSGGKWLGGDDERNAWPDTFRIINEVRPEWVLLENSTNILRISRKWGKEPYIHQIVSDLAGIGYVGRWGCLSAAASGAIHLRRRLWIVAHTGEARRQIILRGHSGNGIETNSGFEARRGRHSDSLDAVFSHLSQLEERLGEPSIFGVDDGMAHRVDRLAAVGEGWFPLVAQAAWDRLTGERQ